jgi:hypothetical protein
VHVDAIVSVFNNQPQQLLRIYDYNGGNSPRLKRAIDKKVLKPPYAYDWLFSNYAELLEKLESLPARLSNLGVCENSCAVSDAYKLQDLIEEQPKKEQKSDYFKVINTGTIGKHISKWGQRKMVYLGRKYLRPVVNKKRFLNAFPNSYGRKAVRPKIIVKGLNLLDGCLDLEANVIPGKTTLVIFAKGPEQLKLVSAIINTPFSLFYLKEKYPASSYNQGTTFTKAMINDLPIPEISSADRVKLVSAIDSIISMTEDEGSVKKIQEEINRIVGKAYGLAQNEVRLLEESFIKQV